MFLEFLGKAMNTSPEQLRDTYASVMEEDYNSIANAITNSLQKIVSEEQHESELSDPNPTIEETGNENMFPSDYYEFF